MRIEKKYGGVLKVKLILSVTFHSKVCSQRVTRSFTIIVAFLLFKLKFLIIK